MSLAAAVLERARELGFDKAGIARAGPAPRGEALGAWLDRGFHGGMAFLARAPGRRRDPALLMPGARSIVCVAKNYYTPDPPAEDPREGRISRHAWGEDYHGLVLDRLRGLREFVERRGGRARAFADAGAVLEKPWAERAGLGWQGKHSILVSRGLGSWFFLGEVLTDLDLEPEPSPARDYCGTCTRCIDRCPSGAIAAPRVVDARRCLSFLTIEHRGPIPRELRPLLGNRIFGCDLCQEACPWNRFARAAPGTEFRPREGHRSLRLADLAALSREEFDRRFRGSSVRRAGYAGFLRNVAVALGNGGDGSAAPALEKALVHDEPLVRGHAVWALGRLGARGALERRREVEREAGVLAEIEAAVSGISRPAG